MNISDMFLASFVLVLTAALMWWTAGVIMFTFTKVLVMPGTPLSVKLQTVLVSGFVIPYLFVMHGALPTMSIIAPINPTPEEEKKIEELMARHCPCPKHRRMRGE